MGDFSFVPGDTVKIDGDDDAVYVTVTAVGEGVFLGRPSWVTETELPYSKALTWVATTPPAPRFTWMMETEWREPQVGELFWWGGDDGAGTPLDSYGVGVAEFTGIGPRHVIVSMTAVE